MSCASCGPPSVSAVQMDVKVEGVPVPVLAEAFTAARTARLHILDTITKEIAEPRADLNPNAPRIETLRIKPDQIGMVIGGSGKTIKAIKELTGADIDIDDDGLVYITGEAEATKKTRDIVEGMTREYQKGEKLEGSVATITDFGAFVQLGEASPLGKGFTKDGLVHISEIAPFRVNRVEDFLKEGQTVPVVVKDVTEEGKISLSIKDADADFIKKPEGYGSAPRQQQRSSRPNGRG